jgi:hypothetical protein
MIKFITTPKTENPILTFHDVDENQFFVDITGNLCQKIDDDGYITIADVDGDPYCTYEAAYSDDEITRIIEHIGKIEF